jgi:hypothetical protein
LWEVEVQPDYFTAHVPQDVRARHAEMMASSGATGRPEDYRTRLSYLLPFRGPSRLLAFCGCCQGPLEVLPALGHWVSWQASGDIAPLCAVCLEVLRRGGAPGSAPVHVLPEYDPLGRRYCRGLEALSPVELAQRRMAEIEARLPRLDPAGAVVNAAAVAREAFADTAGTLEALGRVWRGQHDARMQLGRHVRALQRLGTPDAADELAGIVMDVPGAMQAAREAAATPDRQSR